jgi:hypothetical protein
MAEPLVIIITHKLGSDEAPAPDQADAGELPVLGVKHGSGRAIGSIFRVRALAQIAAGNVPVADGKRRAGLLR